MLISNISVDDNAQTFETPIIITVSLLQGGIYFLVMMMLSSLRLPV